MKMIALWILIIFLSILFLLTTWFYHTEYAYVDINASEKEWCSDNMPHATYRECASEFTE